METIENIETLPKIKIVFGKNFNDSLENLPKNLEELDMYECEYYQKLENLPVSLKKLKVGFGEGLSFLPVNLKKLKIKELDNKDLLNLPIHLENLNIEKFYVSEDETIIFPKNLKKLKIRFSSLYNKKINFPDTLEKLHLNSYLGEIDKLPNNLVELKGLLKKQIKCDFPLSLKVLEINSCSILPSNIEKLILENNNVISKFPNSLKELIIRKNEKDIVLPKELEKLGIDDDSKIRNFEELKNLKVLKVGNLTNNISFLGNLEELYTDVLKGIPKNLEKLKVKHIKDKVILPDKLKELTISFNFETENIVLPETLEKLVVGGFNGILKIPDNVTHFYYQSKDAYLSFYDPCNYSPDAIGEIIFGKNVREAWFENIDFVYSFKNQKLNDKIERIFVSNFERYYYEQDEFEIDENIEEKYKDLISNSNIKEIKEIITSIGYIPESLKEIKYYY